MRPDDIEDLRTVWHMAGAAAEIIDEKVAEVRGEMAEIVPDHERRMHVPIRDMSPLTAVPFPERTIPDPQMKQMVELIEGEGLTVAAVAEMFGYPFSLTSRELARYSARHQRMCLEWSLP